MMASVSARMGHQYCISICGLTNMPTDTKKMAPKRFFNGFTTRSTFSASVVSARILPIMNAPKAELYPAFEAITTSMKQRPIATISKVSSFIHLPLFRRKVGTTYTPTTNHIIRKKLSWSKLPKS